MKVMIESSYLAGSVGQKCGSNGSRSLLSDAAADLIGLPKTCGKTAKYRVTQDQSYPDGRPSARLTGYVCGECLSAVIEGLRDDQRKED